MSSIGDFQNPIPGWTLAETMPAGGAAGRPTEWRVGLRHDDGDLIEAYGPDLVSAFNAALGDAIRYEAEEIAQRNA